jgi:uncharacterized protein (DUF983 family)
MADESNNRSESPTCACGRGDLYEEWLKQSEANEKGENSNSGKQPDDQLKSSETSGN